MGEMNNIIFDCKIIFEAQSFVIFLFVVLIVKLILLIINTKALSSPTFLVAFFTFI